jgi:23S rRNA (uracil1939-C5)-methyltransferase
VSKKKKFEIIPDVSIEKSGGEGKSMGYIDGKVVFLRGAAAGDIADIRLTKVKSKFMEAEIHKLKSLSPLRQEPMCEHYGVCGGCKWQHITYEAQLNIKSQWALDCLQRIGKIEIEEIQTPLANNKLNAYRNKVEFTFTNKAWEENFDKDNPKGVKGLGFHIPGRWDKILDINHCHLADENANNIRNAIKEYANKNELPFWDPVLQEGWLRNLLIRKSSMGDLMVVLSVKENNSENIKGLFDHLKPIFPQVNSWMYVVNAKRNDSWSELVPILYEGKGYLEEKMGNLIFKVRPFSFFQTNFEQALELYKLTREWAEIEPHHIVYDLYTGTGTIAQFVAQSAQKVVGIEYVPEAIEDAKENATNNNLHNTLFFAGDMKEILTPQFAAQHGMPDVIITDPPRDGMHPDVVQCILHIAPKKIVYVSCNPATQARDLSLLSSLYKVVKSKSVDMFPHTHHIENVVQLVLM